MFLQAQLGAMDESNRLGLLLVEGESNPGIAYQQLKRGEIGKQNLVGEAAAVAQKGDL